MARRKEMTRRHIWIDDEDWEMLSLYYGDSIGQSAAVRAILKAVLTKIRSKAETHGKPIATKLDDIDADFTP